MYAWSLVVRARKQSVTWLGQPLLAINQQYHLVSLSFLAIRSYLMRCLFDIYSNVWRCLTTSKQFQSLATWLGQPSPPAFHNLRTFPFFGAIYRKPFSLLRNQNQSFPIMSCEMTPLPCVKITFVWYFFLPFCLYVHLCSYTFIYVHICSYMFV